MSQAAVAESSAANVLYPNPVNGLLPWPDEWTTLNFNCKEPCDMLIGPCVCGAFHKASEWSKVLRYYNAEIRDDRHNPVEQQACTLSYF